MKAFQVFTKPFEAPQRNVNIKNEVNFLFLSLIRAGRDIGSSLDIFSYFLLAFSHEITRSITNFKAFKAFIKLFEAPRLKIKNEVNFLPSSSIRTGRDNIG